MAGGSACGTWSMTSGGDGRWLGACLTMVKTARLACPRAEDQVGLEGHGPAPGDGGLRVPAERWRVEEQLEGGEWEEWAGRGGQWGGECGSSEMRQERAAGRRSLGRRVRIGGDRAD